MISPKLGRKPAKLVESAFQRYTGLEKMRHIVFLALSFIFPVDVIQESLDTERHLVELSENAFRNISEILYDSYGTRAWTYTAS